MASAWDTSWLQAIGACGAGQSFVWLCNVARKLVNSSLGVVRCCEQLRLMQGQGEERQAQHFCPMSADKDGVDKLIGSVRRLVVHERVQQRALLREDIANSLCDIVQASLLTLGGGPPSLR
jgi:hypothetical protein